MKNLFWGSMTGSLNGSNSAVPVRRSGSKRQENNNIRIQSVCENPLSFTSSHYKCIRTTWLMSGVFRNISSTVRWLTG